MEDAHIISLKDVDSTSNGTKQLYLKSINLGIPAGETVALVGRADAGKSTLLRCIALLVRPLTGMLSIDNKNLTFMASRELCNERRNIGYLNGNPMLLNNKTVAENVALPLSIRGNSKEEINKMVNNVLSKVNLDHKALAYPKHLNTLQRIQLEIARVMVNTPKILLCDDLFSQLDQKATDIICNLLKNLQQEYKLTMLISTNDAEIIRNYCTSVIIMQQGSIVETCSVYTFFTNPESEVAKDFLRLATKHELPWAVRRKMVAHEAEDNHPIVRINFNDCIAPEEILSNTLEAHELSMNIIQAYQELISDELINLMVIEIYGENSIAKDAVNFLSHNGLQSEIIGYVPNIN